MKKRLLVSICVSLSLILFLGVGVSYSLWNIVVSEDNVNTAMSGCFDITYSSETEAINLEKQYPISDEDGSKLEPYTFKITNNCDINAYYRINLETLNNSNIDTGFMKASLNNENPKIVSDYEIAKVSLKDSKVANTLKSGYLPVGGSVTFDLRVWIDYDTTVDDIKNNGADKWIGKVVVVSSPVSEDEINKVCQDKGGDLIDDGECRKYYVKLNQQFNVNGVVSSYNYSIVSFETNSFNLKMPCLNDWCRFFPIKNFNINHLYYYHFNSDLKTYFTSYLAYSKENYPAIASEYERVNSDYYYYYNINAGNNSYFLIPNRDESSMWYYEERADTAFSNFIVTDLTLMFGEGNEPDKEWCDKYLDTFIEYNTEGTLVPIKEVSEPIKTSYYDVIDLF